MNLSTMRCTAPLPIATRQGGTWGPRFASLSGITHLGRQYASPQSRKSTAVSGWLKLLTWMRKSPVPSPFTSPSTKEKPSAL